MANYLLHPKRNGITSIAVDLDRNYNQEWSTFCLYCKQKLSARPLLSDLYSTLNEHRKICNKKSQKLGFQGVPVEEILTL